MFEVRARDGLARVCEFSTPRGTVETPVLLPVMNPNQILVSPGEMVERFKAQMLITNAYIVMSDERLRDEAVTKGIHGLLGFEGPVMTDSGTFQTHVYGDLKIDQEEILDFQKIIKSDVGTMLDIFVEPDEGHEETRKKVELTLDRARKALEFRDELMLGGVVQGGVHADLREHCARELSKMNFDVYPIGGVVPLMEDYRFSDLVDVVIASKKGLRADKPVHLFGCGHPMVFGLAVLMGCDLFDSSSYAKYARSERLMYPWGTRRLEDLKHLACECPVCSTKTPEEMKKKDIALHNLYTSFAEIQRIKQAIHEGSLWDLVEHRARHHPSLLSALRRLGGYRDYLERFEPLSREGALFYTGAETLMRPAVYRYHKRLLSRYSRHAPVLVELRELKKPYSRYTEAVATNLRKYDCTLAVNSSLGPVPIELDEMYPIAQSLAPEHRDLESEEYANAFFERFFVKLGYELKLNWPSEKTMAVLRNYPVHGSGHHPDVLKIRAVADMQFGPGAGKALTDGALEITKSKTTDKIRNVHLDERHVLSMRAHDGFFTLKLEGAKILHKHFSKPRMRVVVNEESAEFNRQGKNVFARFVLKCDDEIRPLDEVLIVDERDELVAVGRTKMNIEEMLVWERGVAVEVREGVDRKD